VSNSLAERYMPIPLVGGSWESPEHTPVPTRVEYAFGEVADILSHCRNRVRVEIESADWNKVDVFGLEIARMGRKVADPEMQTIVEVLCWLWFSTIGQHFGSRYDLSDDQLIDGKNHGAADFQARPHRISGVLHRQRLTTKALSGCLHT